MALNLRPMDAAWTAWLHENLERGCDPGELRTILLQAGFSLASIREAAGEVDHQALCQIRLVRSFSPNVRRLPTELAQIYEVEAFMSDGECDEIAAITRSRLRASTVTIEPGDEAFRTSSTCDLSLLGDPRVEALDHRAARLLGLNPAYSEGVQGQHYAPAQQFKPHTDFFEPHTPEYAEHCAGKGNRTWTFMVYLNDVPEGGETHFPRLGRRVRPRKGMALAWNNLNADGSPNRDTLHAGLPVIRGEKVVITKWFRERGAGPSACDPVQAGGGGGPVIATVAEPVLKPVSSHIRGMSDGRR